MPNRVTLVVVCRGCDPSRRLASDRRPHVSVTEAGIAYSERPRIRVARWLSPLLRPGIRRTARKLWVDDFAYAERRYELRQRGEFPG